MSDKGNPIHERTLGKHQLFRLQTTAGECMRISTLCGDCRYTGQGYHWTYNPWWVSGEGREHRYRSMIYSCRSPTKWWRIKSRTVWSSQWAWSWPGVQLQSSLWQNQNFWRKPTFWICWGPWERRPFPQRNWGLTPHTREHFHCASGFMCFGQLFQMGILTYGETHALLQVQTEAKWTDSWVGPEVSLEVSGADPTLTNPCGQLHGGEQDDSRWYFSIRSLLKNCSSQLSFCSNIPFP